MEIVSLTLYNNRISFVNVNFLHFYITMLTLCLQYNINYVFNLLTHRKVHSNN